LAAIPAKPPGRTPDLVVVSHLRWTWVWQRPQHLVSRFARTRSAAGARTWFVEEPFPAPVAAPEIRSAPGEGGVTRVWLAVPEESAVSRTRWPDGPPRLDFDDPSARDYAQLLTQFLAAESPDVLLYTPLALDLAQALRPGRLAYDVMDDLASFLDSPPALRLRQQRLLADADVVFTGGRSLHRSVSARRKQACHLYPSGVDTAHYATSMALRRPHERPVAGYVGVLDERLDLDLLAGLAAALPDWTIRLVGPVAKIDTADLPAAPNLEYPGQVAYAKLPEVMAGFDVALMPFALNEATRSISPTKTPEYLAAGLPVVSTRVPDVVTDYGDVVRLADEAEGFAEACRAALHEDAAVRDHRVRLVQGRQEWDVIAAEMGELLRGKRATALTARVSGATA